ncbi:MAG: zinc dependent phospholipase C family protein [Deltaproteobacteria bacterium]|nr:zinc dependent phospholipase C family protein [Deltaproteobacteria bacterium]
MAGAFTHWMIVEASLSNQLTFARLNPGHPLAVKIINYKPIAAIGAVSPDLPYLSLGDREWADRMHYENIHFFAHQAISNLLIMKHNDDEGFAQCLAWFFGYISHVIADVVIHPIVTALVGTYLFNKTNHRHCEMIQDTYIYKNVTGNELIDANHLGVLPQSLSSYVSDFWAKTLKKNHPNSGTPEPSSWYNMYRKALNLVDGRLPSIFYRILDDIKLFYGATKDFKRGGDDNDYQYIKDIPLPRSPRKVDFKEVFNIAVQQVVRIWGEIIADLNNNDSQRCFSYIKNWNLDLGVDQGAQDLWT